MPQTADPRDRDGQPWGRFRILGELGRGARSRVLRAYDTRWRQEVALKIWSTDAVEGLDELRRDFRLLARTPCPHLPRVRELVEEEGSTALVMELVEGHDLSDVLATIDPTELAVGLFSAIEVLHASGIVHGDIKPQNVRVRSDNTVVLVDLGLAYSVAHPRASLDGTPHYFSPEQLNRESWGPPSDIYAAGLVIHEVVAAPLDAAALNRRVDVTLSRGTIPLPPIANPSLADVLRRCLHPDPNQRPSAEDCLVALAGRPTRSEDPDASHRVVAKRWLGAAQPRLVVVGDPKSGRALADTLFRVAVGRQWSVLRFGGTRSGLRPLHALEGLVDDLSAHLDALDDVDRALLETAFPAFARSRATVVALPGPRHRELARALKALVAASVDSERDQGTLFIVENAQWIDRDSERILTHLLDEGDVRACVVSTTEEAPLVAWTVAESERIDLAPPVERAAELPQAAGRLASLIASLGGRVTTLFALRHGSAEAVDALDDHGLLDWSRDASTVALVRLPPGLPPIGEPALRDVLEELVDAPPETRAGLLRFLGDHDRAVPEALESARQALARGAPSAAERWVRYVVEHDDRVDGHALLARSLADQNQPLDAARAATQAAARVEGADRGHHLAAAADLWLRAGNVSRGLVTLTEACGLLGFSLPPSGWRARLATLLDLFWLRRHALELDPVDRPAPPRLVAAWAAAAPLAYFEYTQAAAMLVRYLRMALEDRHLDHAVRAAALLWNALALSRSGRGEAERLDRFLERWTGQASPVTRAFVATTRAYVMLYTERMGQSASVLAEAIAQYPPTEDGGWALSVARVNRLLALHFSAPPDAAWIAQAERLSQVLADRSDRLSSGLCEIAVRYLVPLIDGDAEAAARILDDEVARQGTLPAAYQWVTSFARCRVALHAGDPQSARIAIGRRPPKVLTDLQHVRTGHAWLRGLAELAVAASGAPWSPRVVRRSIRILHAEQPHWGAGHVEALSGALASFEGRPAEARNRTQRALSLYADAGLNGFVHAHRRNLPWRSLFWPAMLER